MLLNIEIPPSVETIVFGLLGTIKHTRGKNNYSVEFYNNQHPLFFINGEHVDMNSLLIPKTIKSAIYRQAAKLGWIAVKLTWKD